MHFKTGNPVKNLCPFTVQFIGPIDIGLLIKPGLEFQYHHDMFAVLYRIY